jgi:hypothetical protein
MALTLLKPTKDYVVKALEAYPQKLNMVKFINYTNFPIDEEIANSFYTQMKFGIPIYLGKYEIEFFGYKGPLKKKKEKIRNALQNKFVELEGTAWWSYDNKKYGKFIESLTGGSKKKAYPALKTGRGQGTLEHILILPQLYKHLLVMANTAKAFQIREYLFQIEHLVRCMVDYNKNLDRYESSLAVQQKEDKIDQLLLEMQENEKKADSRFEALMAKTNQVLGQNDSLQEGLDDVIEHNDVIEERLDDILPNHVSLVGVRPSEYEIIVISRFINVNRMIQGEGPLVVYKGQVMSIREVRKKHLTDLTKLRIARLGRQLRKSEIPKIEELFRVGANGYIPNAKKTWTPFKRANRRYLNFRRKKTTMFSLKNGWSVDDLQEALEAKDQDDRT